jgi:dUTP pyrophosphatase
MARMQIISYQDTATATPQAAGLDLCSAVDRTIPTGQLMKIPTDHTISPQGTYGQILSRSGMVTTHSTETKVVTIDADYTGNITMVVKNNSNIPYNIKTGDRVAQLIIYKISSA